MHGDSATTISTGAAATTGIGSGIIATGATGVGRRPTGPFGLLHRHSVPPLFGCSDRDFRRAGRRRRIH
ncbi:hypothetical protein Misp05_19620 [Micromonospora sp. NBRC 107095]|nr:hypothetical protein Misp05_19620 [Micromonospora sp. NBRC 107095]